MFILVDEVPVQVTFIDFILWSMENPHDVGIVAFDVLSEDCEVATGFDFFAGVWRTLTNSKVDIEDTGAEYKTINDAREGHARAVKVAKAYAAWACN